MNIYYMSEKMFYGNTAGTKARNDVEQILSQRYIKIGPKMVANINKSILYYAKAYIKAKKFCFDLARIKDSAIVFQYPITRGRMLNNSIKKASKNNRILFIIHDINYLRQCGNKDEEIAFLNCADTIICHNIKMKEKLIEDGLTVKNIILLNCFDYLVESKILNTTCDGSIAYAGNLQKGGFIDELLTQSLEHRFCLYGPNYSGEGNDKVLYKGSFSPDDIPYELKASYGLIWDSLTIDTCTGALGFYTQYNNPHKLSLYLAAGIPVIAWKNAAIASFIKDNKIGVLIDSIKQIDEAINRITESEYVKMKDCVSSLQNKVIKGDYMGCALDEFERTFN